MELKLFLVLSFNIGLIFCQVLPNPVGTKTSATSQTAPKSSATGSSTTNSNINNASPQIDLNTFTQLMSKFFNNQMNQKLLPQQPFTGSSQNQMDPAMPGLPNTPVPNTNMPLSLQNREQNSLQSGGQVDPFFMEPNSQLMGNRFGPPNADFYHINNHVSYFEPNNLRPSYGFDIEQKLKLLEEHNKYRSDVANRASAMNVLRWSEPLAAKAFMEVANCSYVNSGRGASIGAVHEKKTGTSLVSEVVNRWSDEKNRFLLGQNCALTRSCRYSQLIWAKTQEVGCAVKVCGDMSFVACMYNPPGNIVTRVGGNIVPEMAYEQGSYCSKCAAPANMPMRCNSDFLCEWY